MSIRWSPLAAEDYLDAVNYLMERSPSAARRLSERIDEVVEAIAGGEMDGPTTILTTGETVQSWPIPPYRLYYRKVDLDVEVVRLYHQRRKSIEFG